MNHTSKWILRTLVVAAFVYAAYQKLEWLSIVALILSVFAFAHEATPVRRLVRILLDRVNATKSAKYKDFELDLDDDNADDLERILSQAPPWVQLIAKSLKPQQIGLLISIGKQGSFRFPSALLEPIRELRGHGLVFHDARTLKLSKNVSLTQLGTDFASSVSAAATLATLQNPPEVEALTSNETAT